MKTGLCSAIAGAALLALAGNASAAEPITLSNAEMDGVTAGAIALSEAAAFTLGDIESQTAADVKTIAVGGGFALAKGQAAGSAISVHFPAVSASTSTSAAALP